MGLVATQGKEKVIQIDMNIYKVDEEATKDAVEKYLLEAREYKITEYIPEEPKTTPAYAPRYHGNTNVTSSPTEEIAVTNVDEPERRRKHIDRVELGVKRLGNLQQKLIRKRYLEDDNVSDYGVAIELGYSDRHYRRMKSIAIYRLATMWRLIVLKD